jgi:hypothetical protein
MIDREVEEQTARRIEMAAETLAAIRRLREERSSETIAQFHELHARHMRERGDVAAADRADRRATAARHGRWRASI